MLGKNPGLADLVGLAWAVLVMYGGFALAVALPWMAFSVTRNIKRIRVALERIADNGAGGTSDARPGRLGI